MCIRDSGDVAHVHGLVEKVATRCLHFLDGIGAAGKRDAAVGELVERILSLIHI